MHVLIAEDCALSRSIIKTILVKLGHTVRVAVNGREALEMYRQQPCPLVITDWMMPEMTGLELCRALRNDDRQPYTYVIVQSSRRDQTCIAEAYGAGADAFIAKPLEQDEVMARVRAAETMLRQIGALGETDSAARTPLQAGTLASNPHKQALRHRSVKC